MSLCANCSEAAVRQAEEMKPRGSQSGRVMVAARDAFKPIFGNEQPDIRMGDIVHVELIAGAVQDMPWCEERGCSNNYHLGRV